VAPAVIGLILGPLAEQQLRRALAISQGDVTALVRSPGAVALLAISALVVVAPLVARLVRRPRGEQGEGRPPEETPRDPSASAGAGPPADDHRVR
jgi:TctA family transporter